MKIIKLCPAQECNYPFMCEECLTPLSEEDQFCEDSRKFIGSGEDVFFNQEK